MVGGKQEFLVKEKEESWNEKEEEGGREGGS